MKKLILSILVFLSSLTPIVASGFFVGMLLVGPHSDILPTFFRVPIGIALWIFVIGTPLWLSYKTYMHFKNKEQ